MRRAKSILTMGMLPMLVGCPGTELPPATDDLDARVRLALAEDGIEAIVTPTSDVARVALGQALFFDKELSGNRNISCATCHHPQAATGDALSLSKGQGGRGLAADRTAVTDADGDPIFIPRNAPELFNRADFRTMFWDRRVAMDEEGVLTTPAGDGLPDGLESALAAQAMFPVTSRDEMRGFAGESELGDLDDDDLTAIWSGLMARLLAIEEYEGLFAAAYPDVDATSLTFVHAANAIGAFEADHWTLDDSPFDVYLAGDDLALSDAAKRGALLFCGEAGCVACHSGPAMTDEQCHNRAMPQIGPGKGDGDDGSFDFGCERVTGDEADRFTFRTPPLRNVAATGPWGHSGAYTTLEGIVQHELSPAEGAASYDSSQLGEEFRAVFRAEQTDTIVAARGADGALGVVLSDSDVADLIAFLESLTSPSLEGLPQADVPESVPSGLTLED